MLQLLSHLKNWIKFFTYKLHEIPNYHICDEKVSIYTIHICIYLYIILSV